MKTFTAEVIQFMRPNGRQVKQYTELPIEYKDTYNEMIEKGCRFETEVLMNGLVSITISDGEEDIWIEIVANGPKVQTAMGYALDNWHKIKPK